MDLGVRASVARGRATQAFIFIAFGGLHFYQGHLRYISERTADRRDRRRPRTRWDPGSALMPCLKPYFAACIVLHLGRTQHMSLSAPDVQTRCSSRTRDDSFAVVGGSASGSPWMRSHPTDPFFILPTQSPSGERRKQRTQPFVRCQFSSLLFGAELFRLNGRAFPKTVIVQPSFASHVVVFLLFSCTKVVHTQIPVKAG